MATDLLRISILSQPKLCFSFTKTSSNVHRLLFSPVSRQRSLIFRPRKPNSIRAKAVEIGAPSGKPPILQQSLPDESSLLLDVTGMMCGACVSRVKSILTSDDRVDSVVVNILTETAAIRLRSKVLENGVSSVNVAEDLAGRLTDCGFPTKKRNSGLGIGENLRKWKEMSAKKEAMLKMSQTRVVIAWTLVALCCGSHASHILHSVGIHVAHGSYLDILHNSYVKAGLAVGALLGPGRG